MLPVVKLTVRTVIKLYFNINWLANQQNNYNLLILISSYKKLSELLNISMLFKPDNEVD